MFHLFLFSIYFYDVCHWICMFLEEERLHLSDDGININGDSKEEAVNRGMGGLIGQGISGCYYLSLRYSSMFFCLLDYWVSRLCLLLFFRYCCDSYGWWST